MTAEEMSKYEVHISASYVSDASGTDWPGHTIPNEHVGQHDILGARGPAAGPGDAAIRESGVQVILQTNRGGELCQRS